MCDKSGGNNTHPREVTTGLYHVKIHMDRDKGRHAWIQRPSRTNDKHLYLTEPLAAVEGLDAFATIPKLHYF